MIILKLLKVNYSLYKIYEIHVDSIKVLSKWVTSNLFLSYHSDKVVTGNLIFDLQDLTFNFDIYMTLFTVSINKLYSLKICLRIKLREDIQKGGIGKKTPIWTDRPKTKCFTVLNLKDIAEPPSLERLIWSVQFTNPIISYQVKQSSFMETESTNQMI